MTSIADLRKDYKLAALDEGAAHPDPLHQFDQWLHESIKAKLPEPTAMTLATVTADGKPSARIVLLKSFDTSGFTFYTNYDSRKGRELASHPFACLVFHWAELERQVRIEGRVEKASTEEADAYFASRPLLSQLGATASPQSRVIASREWLEKQFAAAQTRFGSGVPRPAHWGGYRVVPMSLEFWQGRHSRLHDRLLYRRNDKGWLMERLAP
ncbi:MAG: pyridoxamine 5'-phosphate oxidase [Burkholderiales bacterium]